MATRQMMRWDPKVHEDILISMFQHLQLSGDQWSKVMTDLRALGYTFTDSALRYLYFLTSTSLAPFLARYLACHLSLPLMTVVNTLGFTSSLPQHLSLAITTFVSLPYFIFSHLTSQHSCSLKFIEHPKLHPRCFPHNSFISTMAAQPTRAGTWDTATHEILLSVVLEEVKPNKDMITSITERMNAQGYNFTFSAMKYYFYSLLFSHGYSKELTNNLSDSMYRSSARTETLPACSRDHLLQRLQRVSRRPLVRGPQRRLPKSHPLFPSQKQMTATISS